MFREPSRSRARWLALVDSGDVERAAGRQGDRSASARSSSTEDGNDDVGDLARSLAEREYAHVRTYCHDWSTWASSRRLPVERLANYDKLVHPEWLREVLAGERPEAAPTGRSLLFHVNFGVPEEYEEGHIPGALYLDTNWLENPARLEPALARGARCRRCARSASPATRRSCSTAATPRATPTRSGRAVAPARSPPRGRL